MAERWPGLLTKREAAEYLGVSESTIGRMKALGEIKSVRLRSLVLYRRSDLDAYIEALPEGDGECLINERRFAQEELQIKQRRSQACER